MLKVITDQSGHLRPPILSPGVVDRQRQTVALIDGVVAQARRD